MNLEHYNRLTMVRDSSQVLDAVGKHQVLIFVHSRKETAKTARYLKEEALKDDKLAQFMQVCLPHLCCLLLHLLLS